MNRWFVALCAVIVAPLWSCQAAKDNAGITSILGGVVMGGGAYAICKASGGSDGDCAAIAAGAGVATAVGTYAGLKYLANRDDAAASHGYTGQSRSTFVDSVVAESQSGEGDEVAFRARWTALTPQPSEKIVYQEKWYVKKVGGDSSAEVWSSDTATVDQGTYESGIDFDVPEGWPTGTYEALFRLQVEDDRTVEKASSFQVVRAADDPRGTRFVLLLAP